MARIKKNREMNIVHFSFFDLLFGAFGAFVFLMIIQILSSLNMVDQDVQKLVDNLVKEKVALTDQLTDLQQVNEQMSHLKIEHDSIKNENNTLNREKVKFSAENTLLQENINNLQKEVDALSRLDQARQKEQDQVKTLRQENKKLQHQLAEANAAAHIQKPLPLKIRPSIFPTAITAEKVNLALAAEGGVAPYSWELTGKIPSGLSFNPVNGFIAGTLKNQGVYSFTVKVTDKQGLSVKSGTMTMKVIKRYEEQKKKVPSLFLFIAGICTTLLCYKFWEKHKFKKVVREMGEKGYEPGWVRT